MSTVRVVGSNSPPTFLTGTHALLRMVSINQHNLCANRPVKRAYHNPKESVLAGTNGADAAAGRVFGTIWFSP